MTTPLRRAAPVLVVVLAAWAPGAAAQLDSALLSKLRFNLTNPGGKSLAMGGAFSAIADDATAALANPAGLGLISSIEIAVSGKRVDETLALATARSVATGSLVTPYPPVTTSSVGLDASSTAVEFAGVVVPISRRLVAALTYAENLRFEGDAGPAGYPYLELRDNRSGGTTRRDFLFEYREYGSAKLSNRLLAGSLAFRVTESLRIGGGVTLNRATFELGGDAGGPHRIVGQTYLSPTSQETLTTTMGVQGVSGTQVGFVAGVHADLLSDGKLTFGADYRWTQASEGTLVLGGDVPPALAGQESRTFRFRVPSDAVRRARGASAAGPHDRRRPPVGALRRDLRPPAARRLVRRPRGTVPRSARLRRPRGSLSGPGRLRPPPRLRVRRRRPGRAAGVSRRLPPRARRTASRRALRRRSRPPASRTRSRTPPSPRASRRSSTAGRRTTGSRAVSASPFFTLFPSISGSTWGATRASSP